MAKIKSRDNIKCQQGWQKILDHSYIAGGNVKWYSHLENSLTVVFCFLTNNATI